MVGWLGHPCAKLAVALGWSASSRFQIHEGGSHRSHIALPSFGDVGLPKQLPCPGGATRDAFAG
eukprot:13786518-Heterocapsa_arctica.AAC.1